jgi:DNA polymerase-3 subunit gamma/tau
MAKMEANMPFYNIYRPHQFNEVLGQEQSVEILKKQVLTGHYHHAYLFFGASGTGKTTTARILAMCLNCQSMNGTGEPCGKCQSCQAILKGQHWDVIEMDCARFRGVDDIKDLCYRANFAPLGKHKVYILDEVHALSQDAFNTLLRLLEEPPPRVIIIMATTHFEKLPDTLTSRCMLLPFSPLKVKDVKQKLICICEKEGVTVDEKHIDWIAETSCGNLRKAENTLEEVGILVPKSKV